MAPACGSFCLSRTKHSTLRILGPEFHKMEGVYRSLVFRPNLDHHTAPRLISGFVFPSLFYSRNPSRWLCSISRRLPYRNAIHTPTVMIPKGGTKSITTPLLIAFRPSLEVASAELRHMAHPWLKAGAAHRKTNPQRMANRRLISLQDRGSEKHPERKR